MHLYGVRRINHCRLFLFLFCCVAYAQLPLGYGVKGGVALTNEYGTPPSTLGISSNGKDYIVGPFVELRLLLGVSIEADALYQPVSLQDLSKVGGSLITGNYASWEFPVLAKYHFRLPVPLVKPLVEAGPSFRVHSGSLPDLKVNGVTFGGGVEFKLPVIRLSSELRYTRWASPGSAAISSPNVNQVELLFGVSF